MAGFFHDAVGEYLIVKNRSYPRIGAKLTILNGLSRFSQPSVSAMLSMDIPVFAQTIVDQTALDNNRLVPARWLGQVTLQYQVFI